MEEALRDDGRPSRTPRLAVLLPLSAVPQVGAAAAVGLHGASLPAAAAGYAEVALPYGLLGVAAVAGGLLLRRSPGPAVAVVGALELAAAVLVPLPPLALLPVAVAVAAAAVRGARWWAVGTVAAMVLLPLGQLFLSSEGRDAGRSLGTMMLLVVALGAGTFLRARRLRWREERREAADRQRIAVEQERVRIARELHDVLAHSLSSISVQAGVGLHLAADRPAAAVEALTTIRDASRSALDEVRGVLGVLRGDERAPLAPGPDLDALAGLVEQLRRSGARIVLTDALQPRPPQPVQAALHRIVQESLTNARRHAPGAAIDVVLAAEHGDAVARVRDRLAGAAPPPPVAGNGITGMTERAAQLGGGLRVTAHDDGIEVVARVPVPLPGGDR